MDIISIKTENLSELKSFLSHSNEIYNTANLNKKCAELFLTKNLKFQIYCEFCEKFWENFPNYSKHLFLDHLNLNREPLGELIEEESVAQINRINDQDDDILIEPKIEFQSITLDDENIFNSSDVIEENNSNYSDDYDNADEQKLSRIKTKNRNNLAEYFECVVCAKKFQRKTAYVSHVKYCGMPSPMKSEENGEWQESENFECKLCFKQFIKKNGLTNHQKFCGKSKEQIKEERLKREIEIKNEEYSSNESPYYVNGELQCKICSKKFTYLSGYMNHVKFCGKPVISVQEILKKEKLEKRYKISGQSNESQPPNETLNIKIEKENDESLLAFENNTTDSDGGESELKCKKCSKTFKNISGWKTHMKFSSHSPIRVRKKPQRKMGPFKKLGRKDRPFKCKKCKKSFETEELYQVHVETPCAIAFRFTCEHCGKLFKDNVILEDHIRAYHTGERPFNCNFEGCNKAFTSEFKLNYHKKKHDPNHGFKCNYCEKKLSEKSKLKAHERIHRNELPYQCHICPKKFRTGATLNYHIKKHMNVGCFPCDVCNQRFNDSQTLKYHKICHSGEKPFGCNICGARFPRKNAYNTHMKTHSTNYEYTCKVCGKSFPHYTAIYTHYKQHGIKYSSEFEKTGILNNNQSQDENMIATNLPNTSSFIQRLPN